MSVLAIIPARSGSKGIPGKNFTPLCGPAPVQRAMTVAHQAGCDAIIVTSDRPVRFADDTGIFTALLRPAELAQDDTPMIAVVQHVLEQIPGPPDQKIVLLQPTQPLREPKHITQALERLTPEVDSVVSVAETCSPDELLVLDVNGELMRQDAPRELESLPTRRQDMTKGYKRDGTVYAFWRKTVTKGNIYGDRVKPLIIPASETCPLDTPEDWAEAERRLREREARG